MDSSHNNELILAAIVATIVFFIFAAYSISYYLIYRRRRKAHQLEIIEFKKQFENQLLRSRIEVQEQTFQQIGKELHDNVGQLLSTAKMLLGLTERSLPNPPDTLLTANATLAQAIGELRSLSKSLDKEWLEQFSFIENLKSEINRINTGEMVHAEFAFSDELPLRSDGQIILFRIVQEAIQNAIKHAHPKNIRIESVQSENGFLVSISDDGTGFVIDEANAGQGIVNMKHRIELLMGMISWNSTPQIGTIVNILLPNNTTLK